MSLCFCHTVSPSPVPLASVVTIISQCLATSARHDVSVISFFVSLNSSSSFSVVFHIWTRGHLEYQSIPIETEGWPVMYMFCNLQEQSIGYCFPSAVNTGRLTKLVHGIEHFNFLMELMLAPHQFQLFALSLDIADFFNILHSVFFCRDQLTDLKCFHLIFPQNFENGNSTFSCPEDRIPKDWVDSLKTRTALQECAVFDIEKKYEVFLEETALLGHELNEQRMEPNKEEIIAILQLC